MRAFSDPPPLLCFSLLHLLLLLGGYHTELEAAMYKSVDGTACVRLLTLSGEIGCGNPGRDKVAAPIVRFPNDDYSLEQKSAVLLPLSELNVFVKRALNESGFREKVAGVLVKPSHGAINGISDDTSFPGALFAPYKNESYIWNPFGSGIIEQHIDFPVFLLSEDDSRLVEEFALGNEKRKLQYPVKVAEFDVVMQTTRAGTTTSDTCLQGYSCLPLGGYSVWSSLPPIKTPSALEKQIVLAIAAMDSSSLFRDKSIGADSPLSGLISLLAAVEALSELSDSDNWEKQLVVAVFTGESWGYLGSRRFLTELSEGGSSVQGLNGSLIHQILEVGSVGLAEGNVFYAHSEESQVSDATQELLDALQHAASSLIEDNASLVKLASKTNPGVPPSSFMSFLNENDSIPGVVLTEFDSVFLNKFYHNGLDVASQINVSSIVAAASLVARTLHILVTGNSTLESSFISINESLVQQLTDCLLTCDPGMTCSLVRSFITPTQKCPNHYVGVFLGNPLEQEALENIDDTARFVWNYLAYHTASSVNTTAVSECSTSCEDANKVCVASTVEHKGICVPSTTRYVPAYSTRLQYGISGWQVIAPKSGDKMGEVDPVFTESYWKVLGVRVYTKESSIFDGVVLFLGMFVTVMSFFIILGSKAAFRKRLKHA